MNFSATPLNEALRNYTSDWNKRRFQIKDHRNRGSTKRVYVLKSVANWKFDQHTPDRNERRFGSQADTFHEY